MAAAVAAAVAAGSPLAALGVLDNIAEASHRAAELLASVDAKLAIAREQLETASLERRSSQQPDNRGEATRSLARTLLVQLDRMQVVEEARSSGGSGGVTAASAAELIHDVLEILVVQPQQAALNLALLRRLASLARECHREAADASALWATGHDEAIGCALSVASELLSWNGGPLPPEHAALAPLARNFAVVTELAAAHGAVSALLECVERNPPSSGSPAPLLDFAALAALWPRWVLAATATTVSEAGLEASFWSAKAAATHGASCLWFALLGQEHSSWQRWRATAERAIGLLGSGQQAAPLHAYVGLLDMGSPLALWLTPLPVEERWHLCEITLSGLGVTAISKPLAATTAADPPQPSVATATMGVATAAALLCPILLSLFGFGGALWPLAPQAPPPGIEGAAAEPLQGPLSVPTLLAWLRPPCAALLSAMLVRSNSRARSSGEESWQQIRSAVPADESCGQGLLPADALVMLFICHAITDTEPLGAVLPGAARASATVLHAALADTPLFEVSRRVQVTQGGDRTPAGSELGGGGEGELEAGFGALLGRPWPSRGGALQGAAALHGTIPTRFPGIVATWGPPAAAAQPHAVARMPSVSLAGEVPRTLRGFLRALDRL